MDNIECANAYSEVLEILKFLPDDDYKKIPVNIIEVIKSTANIEYKFFYNPNKTLDEQNVSKRAKSILAVLYRDYWSTPAQREKILDFQKQIFNKIEEEKKEKYDVDVFKNKRNLSNKIISDINLPIEVKKENFLQKILKKIRLLFNRLG